MQVPGSANALMLGGAKDYTIARSLRLRSSATAYLSKTLTTPTNQKIWTFSGWVKRGTIGSQQFLLLGYAAANDTQYCGIGFDASTDMLAVFGFSDYILRTNGVFRDTAAWYHIVVTVDTTQATAANRIKVYVNGVQQTYTTGTPFPAQNGVVGVNAAAAHNIGSRQAYSASSYFDGYLTEVNFIDGQALTPSSFGKFDLTTGVWKPKKYAGTYGTNGFYLNFSDNSAATAAAIGKDSSGNGNNWTPNNISVTSGATYDSMTDVPTLNSASASNFCTLNPAIRPYPSTEPITDGNLKLSCTNAGVSGSAWATIPVASGKWYFEATVSTIGMSVQVGVSNNDIYAGLGTYTGAFSDKGYAYRADGAKILNGVSQGAYGASYTTNDVIGVALDADAGSITFYKNGTSQGVAFSGTSYTGGYFFGFMGINGSVLNANFGQRPFAYTPPTGFVALNTFNLPDPTIKKPSSNFNVVLDTGANIKTTAEAVYASNFMEWIKDRANANNHQLVDIVRGTTAVLQSNTTGAETTYSAPSGNSVGWVWKANGAAVSNTAGSITSQVSANASAGFSIVTYTGTGANGTVGHGLGVAPKMIILKSRGGSGTNWTTYHASLGATQYIFLNLTNAAATAATVFNNTAPTSSVFSLGTDGNANTTSRNHVAYCFSEVAGYSKFGSYVGNGSSDGTFVHCGFRPKFVIFKRTDTLGSWTMRDSARDTYNASLTSLYANASDADDASGGASYGVDFLSNGFKFRGNGAGINGSGGTFVYMAFAESPFKYSLGR